MQCRCHASMQCPEFSNPACKAALRARMRPTARTSQDVACIVSMHKVQRDMTLWRCNETVPRRSVLPCPRAVSRAGFRLWCSPGKSCSAPERNRGSAPTEATGSLPPSSKSHVPASCTRLPGTPLRVLVVDDDATVCMLYAAMIKTGGWAPTVASSGQEALGMLTDGQRFDVILCDMMMPEMSGPQFKARLARLIPAQGDRVVMMSTDPDLQALALRLHGLFLAKPPSRTSLAKLIERVAAAAAGEPDGPCISG
jgi:CheY-like chemotaxis protein